MFNITVSTSSRNFLDFIQLCTSALVRLSQRDEKKEKSAHARTAVTSLKNCRESPRPAVDSMGALAARAPATMFGYLSLI